MQAEITLRVVGQTSISSIGEELLNLNRVQNKPEPHHCGYCNKEGSCSWGLTKQVMHPYTYELLAEKGWRRCGTYYYKPDIQNSCCKLWTHRMDVNGFKIKKDQRKTVRHVVEWLVEKMEGKFGKGEKKEGKEVAKGEGKKEAGKQEKMEMEKNLKPAVKKEQNETKMNPEIPKNWQLIAQECTKLLTKLIETKKQQFFSLFSKSLLAPEKALQFNHKIDPTKVKCLMSQPTAECDFYCSHLMLLFGVNKKLFKKDYGNVQFVRDVKEFLEKGLNQAKLALVQVQRSGYLLFTEYGGLKMERKLAKEKQREKEKEKEVKNKQTVSQNPKMKQKMPVELEKKESHKMIHEKESQTFQLSISYNEIYFGPLSIIVVPAQVTTESWRMYQRYNEQIHEKPEKSQSSYSGFLCEKALKFIEETTEAPCTSRYAASWDQQSGNQSNFISQIKGKRTKLMGCYHMKYYIQKQLIGVAVVDILPHGLSSVYFFYEPKYKDFRLGVFSSLIEIEYIRWLALSFPQFRYYYMGFYIQNSNKMNYKGNYQPFELLCPITYRFVECTEELKGLIDRIQKGEVKAVQLMANGTKLDDVKFQDIGVYINQKIKIKYQGQMLTLRDLNPRILIPVLGMLRDMVQVWGKQIFEIFTFTF